MTHLLMLIAQFVKKALSTMLTALFVVFSLFFFHTLEYNYLH